MGTWAKPKGLFLNSNLAIGITQTNFLLASSDRVIWWYPELQSNGEKIVELFSMA